MSRSGTCPAAAASRGLLVVAATLVATTAVGATAYAAPGPVPRQANVNFSIPAPDYPQFYDVSCAAKDSCMAVGSSGPTSDKYLAEQWNGSTWRQLPVPQRASDDGFDAVSCPTTSQCLALDSLGGPPELWNGRSWRPEPLPSPLTALDVGAISCASARSCVVVGTTPHAAMWDGTTWHASKTVSPHSPFPNDTVLNSVACVSRTDCVAVGGYETPVPDMPGLFQTSPLAESWNGRTWTRLPTADLPADAALLSVSCTGPATCVAVGGGSTPEEIPIGVAASWNGTAWTALPDPMASLTSVSCMGAAGTVCAALGTGLNPPNSPVAESWNGSSWAPMPLPSPLPYLAALNALSCGGPSACVTVGTALAPRSLAMTWNGARWRISRASKLDMLTGVSCTGVARCVATGGYVGRSDAPLGLAETLTGSSWRTTKLAGGGTGRLDDVSCDGSRGCVAVGAGGLALKLSLAESWDGRTWRRLPGPPGGGLGAVSCVQADCLATKETAASWWNGSTWRPVNVPLPSSLVAGGITDVSCTGTAHCLASGAYDSEPCCLAPGRHIQIPSDQIAFAESWNGKALRLLKPSGQGLGSVSCVTASFCMTVGPDAAKLWNGTSWRGLAMPGSFGHPGLVAVSCASTVACMAVGDYVIKRGEHAVAAVWNGAGWRTIALPIPGIHLADVSCPTATWCVAVGYSYQGQAATRTLAALWNGNRWQILKAVSP